MRLNVYVGVAQADEWPQAATIFAQHAQRFEAASGGVPCLVVPYTQATPALLHQLAPQAVLLSGVARPFARYAADTFFGLNDWLQTTQTPTLAMCGSHQLLGFFFNQNIRRMARLPDEPMQPVLPGVYRSGPKQLPGVVAERGFYALTLTEAGHSDPLFAGMDTSIYVYEDHLCEIKQLPPAFHLLASTVACPIQAIRHEARPLYGVQFHPEAYSDQFSDGKRLLENFFHMAQSE